MFLRSRNLLILSVASLLTDVSSEMIYPLLPLFLTGTLGASVTTVGVIEGVAESLAQILRVFSGALSDRLRRRKPLTIAGYAASMAGKVLLYLALSASWVFAARIVDRFGKGVRTAPRDALIAESVPAEKRGAAFGIHRAADTLGSLIGVSLAFAVLAWFVIDLRYVFLIALIPALLAVLILFAVREPAPDQGPMRPFLRPLAAWKALPRRLKWFLLIVFVFTLGSSSNHFLILRASGMGFSMTSVILLYLMFNVTYFLAAYPAGRLSDRFGRKAFLVGGYAVYGLTYLGFGAVTLLDEPSAALAMWALFGVYGLHMGLTEGVEKALVTDLAPGEIRATVLGLNATIIGLGLFPASLIAGVLWDAYGPAAPFYLGGAIGLIAAVALYKAL